MRILAVLLALLIGGCGLLPEVKDETASWSPQKLYTEAKDAMSDGAYDRAIKLFEQLESRYPYGAYAQQAQIQVAYAYFKQNEQASALAACDRFIKLHPDHPNVDYVYYLKGLINFNEDLGVFANITRQDQTERDPKAARDSFNAFRELSTKFPDSKYTQDALLRMRYLVNALAFHETHVARYYYKRGAYLAAANRAQYAIQTYPDAPAREDALYVMISSYQALGLKDLRDDSERILRQNYPTSPYLTGKDARVQGEQPWWKFWY